MLTQEQQFYKNADFLFYFFIFLRGGGGDSGCDITSTVLILTFIQYYWNCKINSLFQLLNVTSLNMNLKLSERLVKNSHTFFSIVCHATLKDIYHD